MGLPSSSRLGGGGSSMGCLVGVEFEFVVGVAGPLVSLSLMEDFFAVPGAPPAWVVVVSAAAAARAGSGSWTVRMCFASASERVKALSHSAFITSS